MELEHKPEFRDGLRDPIGLSLQPEGAQEMVLPQMLGDPPDQDLLLFQELDGAFRVLGAPNVGDWITYVNDGCLGAIDDLAADYAGAVAAPKAAIRSWQ